MSADENLRKAKDMYAAFDRGEIEPIISGLADNVKWGYNTTVESDIPWFGTKSGPAEVAEGFFQAIADNLDLTLFERKSFVASGNQVAVAYRAEGTFKKNGNGYIDEGMHLWTFDADGKVTEYVGYADTAAVLKAWTG